MISNFLANSPLTWLNYLITPYTARLGIIPETQVATQQGVQTRDLNSFLAGVKCWAKRNHQTVYALKRDQMKGFDYLEPEGFYDAVRAYGLPSSIIDLDRAAQSDVSCYIRTAFGLTERIVINGVTKQGAPGSPYKCALTTSMGHRYLNDLAAQEAGSLVIASTSHLKGDPHLPDDQLTLRVTMTEATDDSYLFARTLSTLQRFSEELEFLRAKVDDPDARFQEIRDYIDSFTFPKFTIRSPLTLIRKIIAQSMIPRCRALVSGLILQALLSIQPIKQADAAALDRKIASKVHELTGFPFSPNSDVMCLPLAAHGLGFPSISRINNGIVIEGLWRDLNHHIPAYRTMARISLADWTCAINGCIHPLDGPGLSANFSRYYRKIPATWIIAQSAMSSALPRLALRLTDNSHVLSGNMALSHTLNVAAKHGVPIPNGNALRSLRAKGVQSLKDMGNWTLHRGAACEAMIWASDGSMVPATASADEEKSVVAATTGPKTLVTKIAGRSASILQGELMGQIMTLALIDSTTHQNPIPELFTDHLNSVRLLQDSQRKRVNIQYTPGHSNEISLPARLNGEADHYASSSQKHVTKIPVAPVPSFFMDDYTFYREGYGWIESNIRTHMERAHEKSTARKLAIGHRLRMASWLYEPRPPPSFPYTRAASAYTSVVQLYARSGQLPLAGGLREKGKITDEQCRLGCEAVEDPHHIFVDCPRYENWRVEAKEALCRWTEEATTEAGVEEAARKGLLTAAKYMFSDSSEIWPLQNSVYYLGHLPKLERYMPVTENLGKMARERLLHKIAAYWHLTAVRLAARIYGDFAKEMARRYATGGRKMGKGNNRRR
ncbi:hypothetical protein PLICRDRAFT_159732 [Plicaturopsis crispa FD-325 SS-3]|nr:hypothetical protein PLICRDRAFT_159732 [Plicaturopsis crispa FD-325 SS-3]